MKEFKNYNLAIEMNDYKVTLITNDNYNIIKVIAEEDINESKKHTYKTGQEIKLSNRDIKDFSQTLKEENTPFTED